MKTKFCAIVTALVFVLVFCIYAVFPFNKTEAATLNPTIKRGLVGWWRFDNSDTTATTVVDKSGKRNNGERNGVTTVVRGKVEEAMNFNGSSGFLSSTHSSSLNITGNITISAWIKPASVASYPMLVTKGTINTGYLFFLNGAKLHLRLKISPDTGVIGNTSLVAGNWYYVTGVYDGTFARVYINGVQDNSANVGSVTLDSNTESLGIGGRESNFFSGDMDDVRIYNRALSPAEIKVLYKNRPSRVNKTDTTKPTLKTGLVGHWTFDGPDVTTNTTTDRSGSGDHGTRTGTKATTGKIGQGLSFNGTSDIISTTLNGFPAATADVTVSFWAKPQNSSSDLTFLLAAQTDETTNRFSITLPYSNVIYWDFGNANNIGRLNVTMNAAWYNSMAFWTFTSQTGVGQKIYRNGVLIASDSDVGTFTKGTKNLNIGAYSADTQLWNGILDDARVYNRALSTAEIIQLYTQGGGKINKTIVSAPNFKDRIAGHWTFDGPDVTTNTTTDKSGNARNGTRNGPIAIRGKIGQAMRFDGANDYIQVADADPFSSSTISVSSWVQLKNIVADKKVVGKGGEYWLYLNGSGVNCGGTNVFQFAYNSNGATWACANGTTVPIINRWYHVVTVYNGVDAIIYVNGREEGRAAATTATNSSTSFDIGSDNSDPTSFATDGIIDDVRFFNRVISAAEVKKLYYMGR